MNKLYVLIQVDGDDVRVRAYKDNYKAAAYVMEYIYGEDWELQMNDDEWEKSSEIQSNYDSLLNDFGFTYEGITWSIEETQVYD